MQEKLDLEFGVRDVIHGFVRFNALEKQLIDHPWFQRLRRIKQLAFTDFVYPGAAHSRFEHSLGVMHLASRLFDRLLDKCIGDLLDFYEVKSTRQGLERFMLQAQRSHQVLRLAALLHDIGHAPFSHAAEAVFPVDPSKGRLSHEDYSIAAVQALSSVIDESEWAKNFSPPITAAEVSTLIKKKYSNRSSLSQVDLNAIKINKLWNLCKSILDSQLDADKLDYLLRDSYHAGVEYGKFDLERIIDSINICIDKERNDDTPVLVLNLAIDLDSYHVAEGVTVARYWMYTEVYFHKTRRIFDLMLGHCLPKVIKDGFPLPHNMAALNKYFSWDDTTVIQTLLSKASFRRLPLARCLTSREHPYLVGSRSRKRDVTNTDFEESITEALHEFKIPIGHMVFDGVGKTKTVLWVDTGTKFNPYKFERANQIKLRDTSLKKADSNQKAEIYLRPVSLSRVSRLVDSFKEAHQEWRVYADRKLDADSVQKIKEVLAAGEQNEA